LRDKKLCVDISKLLNTGISIEMYFIINCIYYEQRDVLEKYVLKCGRIDVSVFQKLIDLDYIIKLNEPLIFPNLKVTDKALKSLGLICELDHNRFFEELKAAYPSTFKVGKKVVRRFHQDMADCRKKYKSIIDSEEKHNLIIKCVNLYIKEQKDSGKMEFTQMLSSFLNQSNYEMYMDEARSIDSNNLISEDNHDVI